VTENQAPEVTLECPPTLTDGEEATFTATGTDPDGDELTYTWYVNGQPVDGETGTTLTITYNDGDRISVRVTDARGASSDEVTAECTDENRPPTVTVECPAIIVYGEPTRISASGSDPDGDRLTYVWKRNGKVIDGATGPVLQTIVERGDTVTVTVSDGRGGFSDETSVDCLSGSRPKISIECPAKLVFGEPATFTATVTDEDGDTVANGGIKLTWAVDGKVVKDTSGSSATLTLKQGQRVDVRAVDSTGLSNAPMDPMSCSGTIVRTPPGGNNGGTGNSSATRTPAGGSVGSGTGTTRGTGAITPQVGGATQGAGAAPGTLAVTGNTLLPWVAAAATLMLLGWVFKRESARRS
jgi:hypothetical protein